MRSEIYVDRVTKVNGSDNEKSNGVKHFHISLEGMDSSNQQILMDT